MAQEWYLIEPPHSQLSGFEDEALNNFSRDGFNEILDSGIATDVELCNYDLSVCKKIKAVIQKNVQDTRLKALCREIYAPIGTCKAGMYVRYKGRYWIIYGLVDDNGMYEKGIMILCNYKISWLNDKNEVIQRWANITSASQYNNGETNTRFYDLRSDQLMVVLSNDEESLLLHTGQRFIVDKRCEIYEKSFDSNVISDTSKPVITYVFSRSDSILFDYGDSGHNQFMAKQDEQRSGDGYYLIDGKGYWLCTNQNNILEHSNKTELLSSRIEYDSLEIYNGIDPGVFIGRFFDKDGNEVDIIPEWKIKCDFIDKLNVQQTGNAIYISVDNSKLINKSFELSLNADGYASQSITISIRAFI